MAARMFGYEWKEPLERIRELADQIIADNLDSARARVVADHG